MQSGFDLQDESEGEDFEPGEVDEDEDGEDIDGEGEGALLCLFPPPTDHSKMMCTGALLGKFGSSEFVLLEWGVAQQNTSEKHGNFFQS